MSRKTQRIDLSGYEPAFSQKNTDAALNDCKLEGETFVAAGNDPYVVFDCSSEKIMAISVTFDDNATDDRVVLYYDTGSGFGEKEKVETLTKGNSSFVFSPRGGVIRHARLDYSTKLTVKKIDFYSNCRVTYERNQISYKYYILVVLAGIILTVIAAVIESKIGFFPKIKAFISAHKKSILIFIVGIFACALLGALATYILFLLKHKISIYLYIFIFSGLAVIFEIFFFSKSAGKKTENLFLAVCLTIGMMMIIVTPVGHASWDTGIHYRYALSTTSLRTEYTPADWKVMATAPVTQITPSDTFEKAIDRNQLLNSEDDTVSGELGFNMNIAHFLSGAAVKTAKFFGLSFVVSFWAGKVPILLIYAFVCYFAIRKLNSGKMLLSVIALFPTSLFLTTNYSYDYWVICFSFLGIAYFYSEAQQPLKPISGRDTLIMYGALFLACIPKAIYLTLLFIPLFMPRKKLPHKVRYYLTCAFAFALLFALFVYKAKTSVSNGGDSRGGEAINSAAQLSWIMSNPMDYAKVLGKFLLNYLSIKDMRQYISAFAYLGFGTKAIVYILLIIILGITDKNGFDVYTSKGYHKVIAAVFLIVTAAMIATALYVDFTAVGSDGIAGCQPRYLIPIIFPACYMLGSFKQNFKFVEKHRAILNMIAFAACAYSAYYDIYALMVRKMV